jgi:hypothetical protein
MLISASPILCAFAALTRCVASPRPSCGAIDVSCSPYWVPVARLAAAQAATENEGATARDSTFKSPFLACGGGSG